MMSKISDKKLIKAAIEGDTKAKDTLKDKVQSVVLPAIKKRGIQDSDENAEMLASQIEKKVLNVLHQFRFRVSLETWVYRITVNTVIQYQSRIMERQSQTQSLNGSKS